MENITVTELNEYLIKIASSKAGIRRKIVALDKFLQEIKQPIVKNKS